jgi:hypothetical protein
MPMAAVWRIAQRTGKREPGGGPLKVPQNSSQRQIWDVFYPLPAFCLYVLLQKTKRQKALIQRLSTDLRRV